MKAQDARLLAARFDADTAKIVRRGTLAVARLGADLRKRVLAAYEARRDPAFVVREFTARFQAVLLPGMLAARLTGIQRARIMLPDRLRLSEGTTFDRAVSSLKSLLNLNESDLRRLTDSMDAHALDIASATTDQATKAVRETLADSIAAGDHIRAGVKRLRETFIAQGLVPENSFTLENLFRTQTQLAYAAGKLDVERSPAIDEILWGYQYSTVGDDRVRPAHRALEGVTMPKDSTFWQRFYPPNGWACRCQALPIFEPAEIVFPPDSIEKDGATVPIAPDQGFGFRADQLFGAFTSIGAKAASN